MNKIKHTICTYRKSKRYGKIINNLFQDAVQIYRHGIVAADAPIGHPVRAHIIDHAIKALNTLTFHGAHDLGVKRLTWRDHERAIFILHFLTTSKSLSVQPEEIEQIKSLIAVAVTSRTSDWKIRNKERRYKEARKGLSVFEQPASWTQKSNEIKYFGSFEKFQSSNLSRHEEHVERVQRAATELQAQSQKPTIRAIAAKLDTTNLRSISKALAEIKSNNARLVSTQKLNCLLDQEAPQFVQEAV